MRKRKEAPESPQEETKIFSEEEKKEGELEDFLVNKEWKDALQEMWKETFYQELKETLKKKVERGITLYPPTPLIWNALNACPLSEVKVVILGQDPYHGGQAHGFSFSVSDGVPIPPSLRNIFRELKSNFSNFTIPSHGNLEKWSRQGVLLLNSVLTVERGKPNSCASIGWERVTARILSLVAEKKTPVVYLLWGNSASETLKKVGALPSYHSVLRCAHPSPYSADRGFFGCKHFLKTNQFLKRKLMKPIDWNLT
jgi:uracil-DNA glycosylase